MEALMKLFKYGPAFKRTVIINLLLISALHLTSCANKPELKKEAALDQTVEPTSVSSQSESNEVKAQKEEKRVEKPSARPLTSEFIYQFLVAEIAGQRGDFATSGSIFYQLAKKEQDARFAERAAKTAAYGHIGSLVYPSVELWASLDPASTEAQQAMTEILIQNNELHKVEPYLAKLLAREEGRAAGFLFINNLLNKSEQKDLVLNLVQSLAKPYPDLAEAHIAVAQAAVSANLNQVALNELNEAQRLNPGWSLAALLKGQLLLSEKPDEALAFYESFLNQYPENNQIRISYAKALVNQNQYSLAKAQFPIILETAKNAIADAETDNINPKNKMTGQAIAEQNRADITAVIGLLSYQANDYESASSYFQQALDLNFKDPNQLYLYLGEVAEKQKKPNIARNWYEKITDETHFLTAQLHIANLIKETESVDKAISYLDEIDHLNSEQQIVIIQAQASMLHKENRSTEAFNLLENAVKNFPNSPELTYDYALSAERLKKFALMETQLRKVIKERPEFAPAYNALGYSFADRNIKLKEALKLIQKALEISPDDHYMLDSLGWVYYKKGDLDQAIIYLKQAYDIHPDPEIAAHLGEVLWKKGQKAKAKQIWNDALTLNPSNDLLKTTIKKFKS
jgi:tetratricopeptide (TPR) repeat protein